MANIARQNELFSEFVALMGKLADEKSFKVRKSMLARIKELENELKTLKA